MKKPERHRIRQALGCACALLLAGCATRPAAFQGVTPTGTRASYDCALGQINMLGYTIEDGNRDAGFIRARKHVSGLARELFMGNVLYDLLTVGVFSDGRSGTDNMRITVSRTSDEDISLTTLGSDDPASGTRLVGPSEQGKNDARTILQNCGVAAVDVGGLEG